MNTDLLTTIQQLGIEERQARVYLATLEVGDGSATEIAKKATLERVSTYYTLDQLIQKGLVYKTMRGKTQIFSAISPKGLANRIESNLDQLRFVMPQLLTLENKNSNKPIIRFFEGREGLESILDDMIGTLENEPVERREILEYVSPDNALDVIASAQLKFIKQRIKKRIRIRWIAPDTEIARSFQKTEKDEYRTMRLVPKERFSCLSEMNIYGNKISLLGESGAQVGVIIEHPQIAQTQREIFELAWLGAGIK